VGAEPAAPKTENAWPDLGHERVAQVENAYICDRCGAPMVEDACKVICLNCGHRFDFSDLNIYFD
jgi:hypothetical protein